jgi:rhodanese-related sulfurtransferase
MFVNVNVQQASDLIARGAVHVIDVREPAEWARGHIAGARLVSLSTFRSAPEEHLPKGGAVLFICAGGVRSQTAARIALESGAARVYSVIGGTNSWSKAGLPLTKRLDVAV